jgi:hypothetical protein
MGYTKSGHSHKGQGIGKVAAEDLKKLDNPFHQEIDERKRKTGLLIRVPGFMFEIMIRLLNKEQ